MSQEQTSNKKHQNDNATKESLPKLNETSEEKEFNGYKGPEPTTYGDWQHKGRVSDF